MSFRLSTLPILCLFLVLLLSPTHTTPSTALAVAQADQDIVVGDPDAPIDDADDDIDYEEEEMDEDEHDQDDQAADDAPAPAAEPDKPAVIDPVGEENASGYAVPDFSAAKFFDDFQKGLNKWVHSTDTKYTGRFVTGQGEKPTFKGDRALIIPEKAKHYGISTSVSGFEDLSSNDMVVQYEVKLDQGMTCGGAYLKLPTTGFEPALFDGATPYSVMFGPDKCGPTDKVHFIFQSKNPITGKLIEHHLKEPPSVANSYDRKTHVYTLGVKSNGSFELWIDNELKKDGKLADSFDPPLQPPKEIDDPDDKKPADWIDEPKISDPDATKPDDWDEDAPKQIVDEAATKPDKWLDDAPEKIPDPAASKPDEWDVEEDGEWEAPLVPNPACEEVGCGTWKPPMKDNPAYKGKWTASLIDNPAYKGVWKPRKIANPDYYEVTKPSLLPIMGLGYELWTMDQGVLFDNIWLGHDLEAAKKFAELTFGEKQKAEIEADEKEAAKQEAEKKSSGSDGKLNAVMEKVEAAVERLEAVLEPVEAWLVKIGAEPYLDKLIDAGIQRPMLAVVFAPLVAVSFFLALLAGKSGRSSPAPSSAAAGDAKKSDAPTTDDKSTGEQPPAEDVKDITESQTSDLPTPEKTVRRRRTATAE